MTLCDPETGLPVPTPMPPDPAAVAPFPQGLALELVLNTNLPLAEILGAYDLTPQEFRLILRNPDFRKEYEGYKEELKKEGWSFRQKSKAQAEAYLGMVWSMVHDQHTPSAVKADLIKQTVKWAGLEISPNNPFAPTPGSVFDTNSITQETLNTLKSLPDNELEIQVMRIISKRKQTDALTSGVSKDFIDVEAEKL